MVDYQAVYEAFLRYAASRNQADWAALWVLCVRRMEPYVKSRARGLTVPLDRGDLDDLVTDSVARVIGKLTSAADVTPEYISKTFYYENRHAFTAYNRSQGRWRRMAQAARAMNEKYAKSEKEPGEVRDSL